MRAIFGAMAMMFTASILMGQGWEWQNPLPQGSSLYSFATPDASNGWAIGYWGALVQTTDGGATWSDHHCPGVSYLKDVSFSDTRNGWICGSDGYLSHTSDGGASWLVQQISTSDDIRTIVAIDSVHAWATTYNELFRTSDAGLTWSRSDSGSRTTDISFISFNVGWRVCSCGEVYRTNDGGESWTLQLSQPAVNFYQVLFVDSLIGWAAGNALYHTTDGGASWSRQFVGDTTMFHTVHIAFADRDHGVAIDGSSGPTRFYMTSDGGNIWSVSLFEPLSMDSYYGVHAISPQVFWAAGAWGKILVTSDGGMTWELRLRSVFHLGPSVSYNLISDITFLNADTGWALAMNGIASTTDGGLNWQLQYEDSTVEGFRRVDIVNANNVWVTGNGQLFHTTNGGEQWEIQHNLDSVDLECVDFVDEMHGWAAGASGKILYTSDGGMSWVDKWHGDPSRHFYEIVAITSQDVWVAYGDYSISHSSNTGDTWVEKYPDLWSHDEARFSTISFTDAQHGWAGGRTTGEAKVFATTNGGNSWTLQITTFLSDVRDIKMKNVDGMLYGWFVGEADPHYTTNGGTTWINDQSAYDGDYFTVDFVDSQNVWVGGRVESILHYGSSPTSDVPMSREVLPLSLRLDPAFPNPFNPSTTIRFSLARGARVSLEIFDLTGRKVETLADEVMQAGEHNALWSCASCPSGMYFARLTTGQSSASRKLLLLR